MEMMDALQGVSFVVPQASESLVETIRLLHTAFWRFADEWVGRT